MAYLSQMYSAKDAALSRLLKLVVRAFYSDAHIIVMEALIEGCVGRARSARRLLESELYNIMSIGHTASKEAALGIKQIREILMRFKRDKLIQGAPHLPDIVDHEEKALGGKAIKGREKKRSGYVKREADHYWWLDPVHLVKVIKYRYTEIWERLNKKIDKSDQKYVCRNKTCPSRKKQFTLMELLLDRATKGERNSGIFRCGTCKTYENGKNVYQQLVLTEESKGQLKGGNERLIKRFNDQMAGILRGQKELEEANEEHEEKESDHKAKDLTEQEKTELFLREAAEELKEDEFSVSIQAPIIIKKKAICKSLVNMPLPWDAHASKFLDEQKKKMEDKERFLTEERRKKKERNDARMFEEIYRKELKRMTDQWQKRRRMREQVEENMRETKRIEEAEKIMIQVKGKPIPLANLIQYHVDIMSATEFFAYKKKVQSWQKNNPV